MPSNWGSALRKPCRTCHVATAAKSVVLSSVALITGHSPVTPYVEFTSSPVNGLWVPASSSEYEKPTPSGCERNSKFDTSLQEFSFTTVVRFLVTLQGPSSTNVSFMIFNSAAPCLHALEEPNQRVTTRTTVQPKREWCSFGVVSRFKEPEESM